MASRAPSPPQPGPGAAIARPAPPKPGMPSTSRPTPPVKTPGAVPAGAKSSVTGSNPIAKAPPVLSVPAGRKPSTIDDDFSDDVTNKRAPVDIDKFQPTSRAVEIGDDGLADAEAALEAMSSFRLAEGALQRNDIAAAEEHARRAVGGDPTQPDYLTLLAWIRSLAGAPQVIDEAIRTMSKVLIEDPSNEKALFYRGKLLVRTNRLPEALNDFNELLSSNPNHREAQAEVRVLKAKLPGH